MVAGLGADEIGGEEVGERRASHDQRTRES